MTEYRKMTGIKLHDLKHKETLKKTGVSDRFLILSPYGILVTSERRLVT